MSTSWSCRSHVYHLWSHATTVDTRCFPLRVTHYSLQWSLPQVCNKVAEGCGPIVFGEDFFVVPWIPGDVCQSPLRCAGRSDFGLSVLLDGSDLRSKWHNIHATLFRWLQRKDCPLGIRYFSVLPSLPSKMSNIDGTKMNYNIFACGHFRVLGIWTTAKFEDVDVSALTIFVSRYYKYLMYIYYVLNLYFRGGYALR